MNVLYVIKKFNDWYSSIFMKRQIALHGELSDQQVGEYINEKDSEVMAMAVGYLWTLLFEEEVVYYHNGNHAYIGLGDVLYDAMSIMLTGHPSDHHDTMGFTDITQVQTFNVNEFHEKWINGNFMAHRIVDEFIRSQGLNRNFDLPFEGKVSLSERQLESQYFNQ